MKYNTETRVTLRNQGRVAAKCFGLSLWPVLGLGEGQTCSCVGEAAGALGNAVVTRLGSCISVLASLVSQHQVLTN